MRLLMLLLLLTSCSVQEPRIIIKVPEYTTVQIQSPSDNSTICHLSFIANINSGLGLIKSEIYLNHGFVKYTNLKGSDSIQVRYYWVGVYGSHVVSIYVEDTLGNTIRKEIKFNINREYCR